MAERAQAGLNQLLKSGLVDAARVAEIDWQVMFYGGAVHAFTNPLAGTDPKQGVAYDEKADRRAFALMKDFFAETL